jgi:hypothetical protein
MFFGLAPILTFSQGRNDSVGMRFFMEKGLVTPWSIQLHCY